MRNDPIEIESSHRHRDQAPLHAAPTAPTGDAPAADDSVSQQRPADVVDAAFAALGGQLARVDKLFGASPESRVAQPTDLAAAEKQRRLSQNQALVANVVTQLEALERQRERLARLLAEVE